MGLLRLLPEQAAHRWPVIKLALQNSLLDLRDYDANSLNRILKAIQLDAIHCWFNVDESKRANCVLLTTFIYDAVADTKSLLIFLIYAYDTTKLNEWIRGFHVLARFAQDHNCQTITGYTDNETILAYVRRFEGTVRSFVSIDLTDYVKKFNGVEDDQ